MAGELSTRLAARLEKARRKLATAKRLLAEGDFEDAAGRAYYAMYHAAHAALLPKRASPRTHKGLAMMLSMHRIKPGELSIDLYRAFVAARDQREYGDYEGRVDHRAGARATDRRRRRGFRRRGRGVAPFGGSPELPGEPTTTRRGGYSSA